MARHSTEYYDTVRRAVADSRLPSIARLVVITVCSGYQIENECGGPPFNPTLSVIERDANMARSTAAQYVAALDEAGWLDRTVQPWDVMIGQPTCRKRETIPDHVRAEIARRDGDACRRCGTTFDLTIDHIQPWSKGGTDDVSNLQLLCRSCNSSKGVRV